MARKKISLVKTFCSTWEGWNGGRRAALLHEVGIDPACLTEIACRSSSEGRGWTPTPSLLPEPITGAENELKPETILRVGRRRRSGTATRVG